MKNRKNKIIITLIMIIALTFSGIAVVMGDGGSSGSNHGGGGGGNACSECSCKYITANTYGVRFSLVYWDSGQRVSGTKSIDVFSSSSLSGTASSYGGGMYTIRNDNSSKYNRFEMLSSVITQTSTNPALDSTSWNSIPKVLASEVGFNNYQGSLSFNFSNISSAISYSSFISSLYNVMTTEGSKYTESKNVADLKLTYALFSKMGFSQYTELSEEEVKNIHLVIEPIITVGVAGTNNTTSNYRLFYGTPTQLAYAFQQYNCNGSGYSNWSLTDSILKWEFGVIVYATDPCNTKGDHKYCALKNYPAVSNPGSPNGQTLRKYLSEEKKSYGVGYIWLGDLPRAEGGCTTAVGLVNDLKKSGKISQSQYDLYIQQIANGSFSYEDPETNLIMEVTEPQSFELLIKSNYDSYNGGYAACEDISQADADCVAALEYINSNYLKGTDDYHDAVAQVRNGTFKYEKYVDGSVQIVSIDKAYDDPTEYAMLVKSVYTKAGGEAKCEPLDDLCVLYDGGTADVDDCETGKTYFKDIEEQEAWLVCEIAYTKDGIIYSSDNTGHDAVETDNGGIVGNSEYCEVFCYEDFETEFPTDVHDVKAGQTFTWGAPDGLFGTVRVTKKCSTQNYIKGQQGYRFEEWEETYRENEEELIEHYMKKGAYEEAKDYITTSSSWDYTDCCNCCYQASCGTNSDGSPCTYTKCPDNCKKRYKGYATSSSQSNTHSSDGYLSSVTGSVSSQSYSTSGYTYVSASDAEAAAEEGLKSKLDSLANSELSQYTGKKNEEEELLEKIRQCTNNLEYAYETAVRFTFEEPVNEFYGENTRNFDFDGELLVTDVSDSSFKDNVDTSKCTKFKAHSYTCSGSGANVKCTPKVEWLWDCTIVTWELEGRFEYRYPTEYFQWYSLKTDATLVNEDKKGSEDEAFFYSIGFGLPTALSLTEGTYELKVTVDNLGDNATTQGAQDYNIPDGHFAPLAEPVNTLTGNGFGFEYACTYDVQNDIFGNDCEYDESGNLLPESPAYCDSKADEDSYGALIGIDIVYRLVTLLSDGDSLDKAFPSIDGNGRLASLNWQLDDAVVKEILSADVYNTDQAMYEIMLDVNAIQKIREDNQTYFDAGKDPYTSYMDANNHQKVYCVSDSNQEKVCTSDFISKLNEGSGYNYKLMGTCLPTTSTLDRAEYILENGCDTTYTYPTINWKR